MRADVSAAYADKRERIYRILWCDRFEPAPGSQCYDNGAADFAAVVIELMAAAHK